ncbi:MAG: TolC family protein, partial [Acidobacteriaceae bacterium]|nr:TolC family protein [Acidobacteriaceae bacterium]
MRVTTLFVRRVSRALLISAFLVAQSFAQQQQVFTWPELKAKFEATNPTLKAAQDNIAESRAEEVTAYLRPNPDFGLTTDGFQISPNQGVWRPFSGVFEVPTLSYLH